MAGIRVNSGVKNIEVNDQGECILLPLGDDSFICSFYKLVDRAQKKAQGLSVSEDDIIGSMDKVQAFNAGLKSDVDNLFGEGTCRKVFGDITPSMDMMLDFFNQLIPFFEEHTAQRISRMAKYSAGRTGSV